MPPNTNNEFDLVYAFCTHKKQPDVHLQFQSPLGLHYVRYFSYSAVCVSRKPKSLSKMDEATMCLFSISDDHEGPECLIDHVDPRVTSQATVMVLKELTKGIKTHGLKVVTGEEVDWGKFVGHDAVKYGRSQPSKRRRVIRR